MIAFCVNVVLKKRALANYQMFVESEYRPQLSLLEREMMTKRDERNESYVVALSAIREALMLPDVFAASWSSDGHHGLDWLKQMPTEYSYLPGTATAGVSQGAIRSAGQFWAADQ